MLDNFILVNRDILRQNLFTKLNNFSDNHPIGGRLIAPLVVAADAFIIIGTTLLVTISKISFFVINLFAAGFSKNYNIEDALYNLYTCSMEIGQLLALPIGLLSILYSTIKSPQTIPFQYPITEAEIKQRTKNSYENFIPMFSLVKRNNVAESGSNLDKDDADINSVQG